MFKSTEEAVKYGSKVNSIAWVKKARIVLKYKLENLKKVPSKCRTMEHWDKISKCNTDIQFCNEAVRSYLNKIIKEEKVID